MEETVHARTLAAMFGCRPVLTGIRPAAEAIPGFHRNLVLHAGPPLDYADMVGPMRAAIAGALVHEGLAATLDEAGRLAASGDIDYASAHDRGAVGAMAGIVTASMPMFIVRDEAMDVTGYATINEGLGSALRFGANDEAVLKRLDYIRSELAPLLARTVEAMGGIDVRALVAEALRRGDECHNRNKAGTALFLKTIAADLIETGAPHAQLARALRFIGGNDHFFLNISMAHAKAVSQAAAREGGPIVTVMAGNGRQVGIRLAAAGSRWFTAPAEVPEMRLFPGKDAADATPTMGDSYVTEAIGLGGFALAAAPAIAEFVGGGAGSLRERSLAMYGITAGEHPEFLVPALEFRGVPVGIDVHKVVTSGLTPIVNTGVASKHPGVGQIGAGVLSFPLACFQAAHEHLRGLQ
jgi:hypothetical protein